MTTVREPVLVAVLVLAVAVGPAVVLAGDAGTGDGEGATGVDTSIDDPTNTTNTTEGTVDTITATTGAVEPVDNSTVSLDDPTVSLDNSTTALDEPAASVDADTGTMDAALDEDLTFGVLDGGTQETADTLDGSLADATDGLDVQAGDTVGVATGTDGQRDWETGALDEYAVSVGGVMLDVSARATGSGERDRAASDAGPEGRTPDRTDRRSSAADTAGDGATTGPVAPFGRGWDGTSTAGGAAVVGAGAVGAGLLARRTGALAALQPTARSAASTASNLAPEAVAWLRDRFWRVAGLAGYQRYADDDPLEHDTRAAIYEHLQASPGSYLSEVADAVDAPLSTVRYHVSVLAFENLVRDAELRGRRRYFPLGTDPNELDVALNDDAPAAVLETLARDGPDSVSGLAETLDRDPSTVTHHLQRLADDGLVERERDGRAVVNRAAPAVEAALEPAPTEADAPVDPTTAGAD